MSTAARSREGGTSQRKDEDMAAMGAYGDNGCLWRQEYDNDDSVVNVAA